MPESLSPDPAPAPGREPAPAPGVGQSPSADGARQVVLVKDDRRFVFRFTPGDEAQVLQTLVDMAKDPESGLDWFDAAVLSHQVGQHFTEQLEQLLRR